MDSAPLVTILTDFGTSDGYVAAMKGVVLSLCRQARIIDITHEVPPFDVFAGALALQAAAGRFPSGTIHVAVVDPGVGTARRPLLVESAGATLIGPDNGVLSLAVERQCRIYQLDREEFFLPEVASTFHGRDVFAPVAGHLAAGRPAHELATAIDTMVELTIPLPNRDGEAWVGEIIHTDRFGNLVTTLRREHLGSAPAELVVELAGRRIHGISATYGDVALGTLAALIGSDGYLEIAVRGGSASAELDIEGATDKRVRIAPLTA